MKKGENIRLRIDGRFEARYIKSRDVNGKICYGYCYGKSYEEAKEKRDWQLAILQRNAVPKLANLLILGAGSHGREVLEIAENLRIFNKISFLDDYHVGDNIIGKCTELNHFLDEYPFAFPGVGNPETRKKLMNNIIKSGFVIPTLIDTTAVISREAIIGYGTVVCAKAVINIGANVGNGCIISSGAIIARNARMNDFGFLNSGETILENGDIK